MREELSRWCHGGPKRARSWKRRIQPKEAYSSPVLLYSEKAALAGVLLVAVDPRNSSRECSHSGHTAKENRKTQDKFACLECGFALHADINAAINIRSRASRQVANRSELCCA